MATRPVNAALIERDATVGQVEADQAAVIVEANLACRRRGAIYVLEADSEGLLGGIAR